MALQKTLYANAYQWAITCQKVGIRDIIIPQVLAYALSKQVLAEREMLNGFCTRFCPRFNESRCSSSTGFSRKNQ